MAAKSLPAASAGTPKKPTGASTAASRASSPAPSQASTPMYDPTAALASINHKIALLEEQTQGFVEINAKTADEARKRVKSIPTEELEGQYIDLFQEMKRQERNHLKERSRLNREKTEVESSLARTMASRTKIEARTRDLANELKRLMDENRRLTSLFESARGEIEAIKEEFEAVRSEPALALGRLRVKGKGKDAGANAAPGVNADGSARDPTAPTVGINVVCKGRREHLHFLVPTGQPLAVLFDTWSSRFPRPPLSDVPAAPSATGGGANGGNKRAHARAATAPPDPPIPPQSLGPPFIFTFAGRVLGPDETADGVGLEEGDSLVAVEVVDLAREPGKGEDDAVTGNPLTKAAKKNLQAVKTQVEAVLDDVVRERLKLVFRQYETRERQFEAIVRSKDLEILLAKARAEQAKTLSHEAQDLSDQVHDLSYELTTLRCSQDDLLEKLVSLARAPTPEKAANLSSLIRDVVARQQAEALEDQRAAAHLQAHAGSGAPTDAAGLLHPSAAQYAGHPRQYAEVEVDVELDVE